MTKMKNICVSIVLLSVIAAAQPPIEFIRTFEYGGLDRFIDVYAVSDGGYIMCGFSGNGRDRGSDMIVVRVNQAGGLSWTLTYGGGITDYTASSIIETDNGDFLTGGGNYNGENQISRFIVTLIDNDGDVIWQMDYGNGRCYAVIELKSGNYLLAGSTAGIHQGGEAQLILIESDGEVIWRETYDQENENNNVWFTSIRETQGGVVASGMNAVWVIKADLENGEVIWSRTHEVNAWYCSALTSTTDGGFALALWSLNDNSNYGLFKIDSDGQRVWYRDFENDDGYSRRALSVERLNDGGFAVVGHINPGRYYYPMVIRTNSNGVERWRGVYNLEDRGGFEGPSFFYGVTRGLDGSIVAVGTAAMNFGQRSSDALLMKLEPLLLEPVIFEWSPEDTVFSVLLRDTITFMARARDQQGDDLFNLWIMNEDRLGVDTVETITFEELGEYLVQCQVSDGENIAVIRWHVTSEEFYIEAFAPDSLSMTIQRDRELDFSLGVRMIEGLELNYRWILTDRAGRNNDIGEESEVSHHFDLAGEIGLEGRVYHEGVEHSVHWTINVRSLLYWWTPHERELEIPITREVEFSVIPFQSMPDSLEFMWFIDGIDEEIFDLGLFHVFRDTGVHTVTAIAYDGAEADTVVWTITVFNPDAVGDGSSNLLPSEVTLYPAAPNPFNSTTRVRYFLPTAGEVRLSIYDSAGRLVQTLSDGWQIAGDQLATLQGADLAAGVYLLRLEAGSTPLSAKVVLLK